MGLRVVARRGAMLAAASVLGLTAPLLGADAAFARTNRAVVVAVTAYPNLPPNVALVGPNHDAALVRDYLLNAAPTPARVARENLVVLADGLAGADASPTHAKILETLKDVAAKAERDDFVYLHFSGHGAQQPVLEGETDADETDGLDEIFLPADTSKWADRSKGVPNALADNEIKAALDAIRAKGAFVWVVFDACHSGTATRDALPGGGGETERKVEAAELGIPDAAMQAAEASAASRGTDADAAREAALDVKPTGADSIEKGGMVAFFAAQTVETTPEMPLPKGREDATRYGLFTYTIFSKLAERPNVTYRQLGAAVLQQYAADARQRPTPLFEGDLDAPVWGTTEGEVALQWPLDVETGALPAGRLHRLAPGAKLAILPSPASDIAETLGYVEVRSADNLTSRVAPVEWDGKPKLALSGFPANAYARVEKLEVDYELVVARPKGAPGADLDRVDATLDRLAADKDAGFRIKLVDADAPADLKLALLPEREVIAGGGDAPALFLLPPSGEVDRSGANPPPRVMLSRDDPDHFAEGLGGNLRKIFRATGLGRLAAASAYAAADVAVSFDVRPAGGGEPGETLDAASVPVVHPGDEVHIDATNNSDRIIDLNVLYVGSDWSITHIAAERLVPGASLKEGLLAFTDTSFGRERMIAVLTEAPAQSEIQDLSFLAQDGVRSLTRDAGLGEEGSFEAMLDDLGAAPGTRSAMKLAPKGGSPKGGVMIFAVETRPKG